MRKILLLIGSLALLEAGTASAQTSVRVSIGFGVPPSHFGGTVFIGRPHLRPGYRPYYYFHRFHRQRFHAPRYYRPFYHRPRGFGLVKLRRFHRGEHELR